MINEPAADEYFFSQVLPDTQTFNNINKNHVNLNISSKLHEFSNIVAIVLILAFAAIYRSKGFDIAGLLVREECLKPAVTELFVHSGILIAFSVAVIFSLYRLDILVEQYQVMLAADCCILVVLY